MSMLKPQHIIVTSDSEIHCLTSIKTYVPLKPKHIQES